MSMRIQERSSNSYGKLAHEWSEIKESYDEVFSLLKQGATYSINTSLTDIEDVCAQLIRLI